MLIANIHAKIHNIGRVCYIDVSSSLFQAARLHHKYVDFQSYIGLFCNVLQIEE